MTETAMLRVEQLHAWYGDSHVLHGVDMHINKGECVCLLGRNGAGRSTILRSIVGLLKRRTGSIRIEGQESIKLAPHTVAKLGLGYCPEERGIYSKLTCEENLLLPPVVRPGGMTVADIYDLFPNLLERRHSQGTRLSGGEQQMLAMARILRTGAPLLLLDEISEGLAPVVVQKLGEIIRSLKARGYTILLVEQNFRFAAPLADRFYVVEHGSIVDELQQSEIACRGEELKARLGI